MRCLNQDECSLIQGGSSHNNTFADQLCELTAGLFAIGSAIWIIKSPSDNTTRAAEGFIILFPFAITLFGALIGYSVGCGLEKIIDV